MSSAFLSSAACTAPATAFGNFGARRAAGFLCAPTCPSADVLAEAGGSAAAAAVRGRLARAAAAPLLARRGALPVSALLFAMQVVYRSIQLMRHDVPRDRCRHEIVNRKARGEPCPDLRRGDVARP